MHNMQEKLEEECDVSWSEAPEVNTLPPTKRAVAPGTVDIVAKLWKQMQGAPKLPAGRLALRSSRRKSSPAIQSPNPL